MVSVILYPEANAAELPNFKKELLAKYTGIRKKHLDTLIGEFDDEYHEVYLAEDGDMPSLIAGVVKKISTQAVVVVWFKEYETQNPFIGIGLKKIRAELDALPQLETKKFRFS